MGRQLSAPGMASSRKNPGGGWGGGGGGARRVDLTSFRSRNMHVPAAVNLSGRPDAEHPGFSTHPPIPILIPSEIAIGGGWGLGPSSKPRHRNRCVVLLKWPDLIFKGYFEREEGEDSLASIKGHATKNLEIGITRNK